MKQGDFKSYAMIQVELDFIANAYNEEAKNIIRNPENHISYLHSNRLYGYTHYDTKINLEDSQITLTLHYVYQFSGCDEERDETELNIPFSLLDDEEEKQRQWLNDLATANYQYAKEK